MPNLNQQTFSIAITDGAFQISVIESPQISVAIEGGSGGGGDVLTVHGRIGNVIGELNDYTPDLLGQQGATDGQAIIWNDTAGEWQPMDVAGGGAVDSVNGQTGVVVLDTDDIAEGLTNLYYTEGRVDANTNVAANTAARHTHANKAILDAITSAGSGDIITSLERTKLDGIEAGAQVNVVDSVNGATGVVVLTNTDVGAAATVHTHTASDVTDFDTEVGNQTDVAANTSARHSHANKAQLDLVTDGDHDVRTDNPHGVTAAQAGAADAVHSHTAADVTDFDTEVGNHPDVALNTTHRGLTNNPHGVTAAQLGLPALATGIFDSTASTMSFVDGTRTFSITPTGADFDVWVDGTLYTKSTAQTVVITDANGFHYIYFDSAGVLQSTQTKDASLFKDNALVASVFWQTTSNIHLSLNDRRHGVEVDRDLLYLLDKTEGPKPTVQYVPTSLGGTEDGSLDTHAQLGMDAGSIIMGDLEFSQAADTEPVSMPIFYRENSASDRWVKDAASNFPVKTGGTGRLAVNSYLSGYGQFEIPDGAFCHAHIFVTLDPSQPYVAVQGRESYGSVEDAKTGLADEVDQLYKDIYDDEPLPFEGVLVTSLWYESADTMTNAVKAATRERTTTDRYFDWTILPGSLLSHFQLRDIGAYTHEEIDGFFASPALASLDGVDPATGISIEGVTMVGGTIPDLVPSSGFPNIADSTLSFDDGTRTFTIAPAASTFVVWVNGNRYEKTSENVTITDSNGIWFIYYDDAGVLTAQKGFTNDLVLDNTLVGALYWNAFNNEATTLCDERHSLSMAQATQLYLRNVTGIDVESGFGLTGIIADGDGSLDTHAQLGTLAGEAWYQDIGISVAADAAPAQIPVYFREDAPGEWKRDTPTDYPLKLSGSTLAWNTDDYFGDWGQQTVSNGNYMVMHLFITNETTDNVIAIQGRAQYATEEAAIAGAKVELDALLAEDLPVTAVKPIGAVLLQGDTAYTNSVNARIVSARGADYLDWLGSELVDHDHLLNVGSNTHAEIDTHIATVIGNPHGVTLADVGGTTDHTALSNIGTNTHAQIDTHLGLTAAHIDWTNGSSNNFSHIGTFKSVDSGANCQEFEHNWSLSGFDVTARTGLLIDTNLAVASGGFLLAPQIGMKIDMTITDSGGTGTNAVQMIDGVLNLDGISTNTPPIKFAITNPAATQSWGSGAMRVEAAAGSSATGESAALYTAMTASGTGTGYGYKGYCASTSGATGGCVGVIGLSFPSASAAHSYLAGVDAQLLGGSGTDVGKRMGLRVGGASLMRGATYISGISGVQTMDDLTTPDHFTVGADEGNLFVTDVAEFEGEVFCDGNESSSLIETTTTPYTAAGVTYIMVDASAGNKVVDLPAISGLSGNRKYVVKKIDSSANTVTIDANGSDTIDGGATQIISTQYTALSIIAGSEWHIV